MPSYCQNLLEAWVGGFDESRRSVGVTHPARLERGGAVSESGSMSKDAVVFRASSRENNGI